MLHCNINNVVDHILILDAVVTDIVVNNFAEYMAFLQYFIF
jgi:hypothetical protein